MSHYCVSGTTRTTACCMNASTMAFVRKEDPEGTHSSLKILLMTILITGIPVVAQSLNAFVFLSSCAIVPSGPWALNTMTTVIQWESVLRHPSEGGHLG